MLYIYKKTAKETYTMSLKKRIEQEIVDWKRLSGKKKTQMLLKKIDLSDVNIRRLLIIGGLATDYFPELLSFTPQETETENEIEFAPLINFLISLSQKRTVLDRFIKKKKSLHPHNTYDLTPAMHANAHLQVTKGRSWDGTLPTVHKSNKP
jgi:hypothetical protein